VAQLVGDPLALLRRCGVALPEGERVVGCREGPGLARDWSTPFASISGESFLWYQAAVAKLGRNPMYGSSFSGEKPIGLEIQHRRHEHDAVQVEAVARLEIIGKAGCAKGAVTLADDELGRQPAAVAGRVEAYEVAHARQILLIPWNWPAPSFGIGRLKPVETGSMKTRSVRSSHVDSLSAIWYGGAGASPSGVRLARLGPMAPMCSQIEAEPGPPLKQYVTGRLDRSVTSSSV